MVHTNHVFFGLLGGVSGLIVRTGTFIIAYASRTPITDSCMRLPATTSWDERTDPTSFLELTLLFGWDVHLLPSPRWFGGFACHGEFATFYAEGAANLAQLRKSLDEAKVDYKPN